MSRTSHASSDKDCLKQEIPKRRELQLSYSFNSRMKHCYTHDVFVLKKWAQDM
jgi:hypothetical protein